MQPFCIRFLRKIKLQDVSLYSVIYSGSTKPVLGILCHTISLGPNHFKH